MIDDSRHLPITRAVTSDRNKTAEYTRIDGLLPPQTPESKQKRNRYVSAER
jgi:hypothetical protein